MTRSIAWDKVSHADVLRAIQEYDRLARIVQEACDASGGRGEGALSVSERRSPT